jgi:uncharacterized protein
VLPPSQNLKVLLLPGWLNSDADHWQSRWERLYGYERVVQHDWDTPLRGDWITRLEDVVLSVPPDQSVVFAAHSLGCHLVAAWAQVSRSTARVQRALLVAAPDLTRPDLPAQLHSWRQGVFNSLPFAATCVVSSDDPFGSQAAGLSMATSWGANCVKLGPRGHINAASGLGDWPEGHRLLLPERCPSAINENQVPQKRKS